MTRENRKWLEHSVQTSFKFYDWYFNPIFMNTSHIQSDKPALYIGNHTLYSIAEPLLWNYLHREHGIYLRALGDNIHFKIPVWREMLEHYGVQLGTPENCRHLMQQGESVLVFPGGAREVFKRKNEAHQLIWKQRTGFARMAIEHGYDIVPFAILGGDDCFDILVDADDVQDNIIAQWLIKKFKLEDTIRGGDIIPTVSTGVAKLPIPRPERLYYSFGERVSTAGLILNKENEWQIREQVADAIENQLNELENYRSQDRAKHWGWLRKKLTKSFKD